MKNLTQLQTAALSARKNAYAPYSKFQVGAAIQTSCGKIFTGCNVENASYGLTICAERVAVTTAVAAGHQDFTSLTLVIEGNGTPCGACRQFLAEFNPNLPITIIDPLGNTTSQTSLTELLPKAFSPKNFI